MKIISFYTPTWEYPSYAAKLIDNCKQQSVDYNIEQLTDTGSWILNTKLKSAYIKKCMDVFDEPLLWIDVDGSLVGKPEHLNLSVDFMGKPQLTGPKRSWHVGTLFFNNTDSSKKLINDWVSLSQNNPNGGTDEFYFEQAWQINKTNIKYDILPDCYFKILTKKSNIILPDDVIVHRLSTCDNKMAMKSRH